VTRKTRLKRAGYRRNARLAEVNPALLVIPRHSRDGGYLRSARVRRSAWRVREKNTADAPAARAVPRATARLTRLRPDIPQPPRTSALPVTVSNRPPSVASAGDPERNRKRPPNLAQRRPVGSGASAYGTTEACRAPTRTDRRGRSARPPIRSATRSGVDRGYRSQCSARVVSRVQVGGRVDVGREDTTELDIGACPKLVTQSFSKPCEAGLAGAVARRPGHRHPVEDRGNVYYHAASSAVEEVRQRRVAAVDCAEQVQFDQAHLGFEQNILKGPHMLVPALLTHTSIPPKAAAAALASLRTWAESVSWLAPRARVHRAPRGLVRPVRAARGAGRQGPHWHRVGQKPGRLRALCRSRHR
jgi:hypothetical protein